jgi:hypothetical protein
VAAAVSVSAGGFVSATGAASSSPFMVASANAPAAPSSTAPLTIRASRQGRRLGSSYSSSRASRPVSLGGSRRARWTGRSCASPASSSSIASPSAYQADDRPPEPPAPLPLRGACAARAAVCCDSCARLPPAVGPTPSPSAVAVPTPSRVATCGGSGWAGDDPDRRGSTATTPAVAVAGGPITGVRSMGRSLGMSPGPRAPSRAIACDTDGCSVSARRATSSVMMWPLSEPWRSASITL